MSDSFIANTHRIISISPQGAWTPGSPVYIQTPAAKMKVNNIPVLVTQISWTITGCTAGAFTGGGGGSIPATAVKCKADNQSVMRENDTGQCQGVLTNPNTGATLNCTCEYKITNAGQIKVKGE